MRQYIGARYTTKIYQNSQDPGSCEWESGVIYEPLTIVSYQNSSYLSRTEVPATAGNPATATQYWAQTGFYNGQIAQLQQDVARLDLVKLTHPLYNKKIQIFGDSISVDTGSWVNSLHDKLDDICTISNNSVSGRRMFELVTYLNGVSSIDADIVIVFIGTNDFGSGTDLGDYGTDASLQFSNCCRKVFEQIKSKAGDDAKIIFITPLNRWDMELNTRRYSIDCYRRIIVELCKHVDCAWINGNTFPNYSDKYSSFSGDGLHPNADYYDIMSDHIIDRICAGGDNCDAINNKMHNVTDAWNGTPVSGSLRYAVEANTIHVDIMREYAAAIGNSFQLTNGLGLLVAGDGFFYDGVTYQPTQYINWHCLFNNTGNEIYAYDGEHAADTTQLSRKFYGSIHFRPSWMNPTF